MVRRPNVVCDSAGAETRKEYDDEYEMNVSLGAVQIGRESISQLPFHIYRSELMSFRAKKKHPD